MSTEELDAQNAPTLNKLYDQFILFGDSITQQSGSQNTGFGFAPALQNGKSDTHMPIYLFNLSIITVKVIWPLHWPA